MRVRSVFEALEGRSLPSGIGFVSGLGVGVTGSYAAIRSNSVATDAAGDTFATGSFRGTGAFNPNASSSTITTNNTYDTFIAKYGPTGALIWVETFAGQVTTTSGGSTIDAVSQGSAIAVDGSGNIIVAGSFSGTVAITEASGVTSVTAATSATEAYVAKLGPSGVVMWFDAVGGTAFDTDSLNAVAFDGSGGAVIAGSFSDSATFGPTTLTAGGSSDAFVARVNGGGTFLWAVATRGLNGSNASVQGVAVDASGNVDLAGFFSGTVDWNPSSGTTNLTSIGSDDTMLWKLSASGGFLWARSYGSTDYDAATAVAVDASGDLYASGAFSDTVNFGTAASPDSITAGPVFDAFLLKVDPNGNTLWADGLVGPSGSSKGQGVAADPLGFVHVAGTFSGSLAFSSTQTLTSVGSSDAFVAGYDPGGNLVYALQAGATNFNAALGVAVNSSGAVAITGTYSGSIAFGPSTLPSFAKGSVFVAGVVTQLPPVAPSTPVLEASSDSGTSHTDGITNVTSPVLDVTTAVATDAVELLRNGVEVAQRIGPGALIDPGPLAQGTSTYTAIQVSPAGLASPSTSGCLVTILTVPPAALAVPSLAPADDSGTIGDGITNVNQPRLSVVAGGGLTIQLLNAAGTVIGSAYQASGGTCLVTPFQPLTDGVSKLGARAVDVAGNIGLAGPAIALTIDTTPPASPSSLALLSQDDSGLLGDNLTNVRQPRLTGTAEPNSMVQVVDANGIVDGSAIVTAKGSFTVKLNTPLADGSYVFSARATDAAGNRGPLGASMTLTILATPPPMPSIPSIFASDVSGPSGSNLTNVRQPRITGTAKSNTTVEILTTTGTMLASASVGSSGSYTIKVANPLADGLYLLDAVDVDAAGNTSQASGPLILTIDTTPPAAPSVPALLPQDDSGTLGDNLTNVRQPRITGTAEPYSTVQLVDPKGNVYGSAVAASNGAFTVKFGSPLADGSYVFLDRASDAAGNQGPLGPSLSLTILATPPPAPAAPSLYAADDSGGPCLTNFRQPRLTGQTVANASVQLIGASGSVLGLAISASNGIYIAKLTSPLADGTYAIHAVATDAAGNVSPPSAAFSLTILATPPLAPSSPTLLAADDSGTVGDRITNVKPPRLTGTATPGLTVRLLNSAGAVLGSATVSSTGAVTVAPSPSLADGTYVLDFVAIDAAGNLSAPGGTISLTIKATPPPQPTAPGLLASNDTGVLGDGLTSVRRPILTGSAAPGGRVDWLAPNGSVIASTTASAWNGSYQLQPPTALVNGVYPVKVRETDVAGNVSPTSPTFTLTIRADPGDDFGNSQTDVSVFRTTDDYFFVQKPTTGALFQMAFGGPGFVPINGDFFGDGHNDIAVYQPSNSTFYAYDPANGATKSLQIGQAGDVPVPADYDGDGLADFAAFNPSNGTFLIHESATNTNDSRVFGGPGFVPVPADYFGNGHADLAVYLPSDSTFYVLDQVVGTTKVVAVGLANSTPVPADYEGLGHVDPAVYEPSTSTFVIQMSATNKTYTRAFGGPGDIAVPGDYLGNNRADLAVYQPSVATFYALDIPTSSTKVVGWGTPFVTRPTLAPITSWFSIGSKPAAKALSVPDSSFFPVEDDALIPLTTDLDAELGPEPKRQAKAVDLAIDSLGR